MNSPTLSLIIVSYNTASLTKNCLFSVCDDLGTSFLKDDFEIIVIDNNSSDDSVQMLEALSKKHSASTTSLLNSKTFHLIKNKENLGFAQASNQGIKLARGKFILLLNSDTVVIPGALNNLITTYTNHPPDGTTARLASEVGKLDHLGILAATLLNQDGSIQPQGGSLPNLFTLSSHMFFWDNFPILKILLPSTQKTGRAFQPSNFENEALDQSQQKSDSAQNSGLALFQQPIQKTKHKPKPKQIGWVGGTAMMIRHEVVDEIGYLDENIFMYGEDIEYCLRAKKHHWDIAIDPSAKITHLGSASSGSENAILGEIKAYLYIWAKHKPHWQQRFVKLILFWGIMLRIVLYSTLISKPKFTKTYKKALNLLH